MHLYSPSCLSLKTVNWLSWSSSQGATFPFVYHTRWRLGTVPFIEVQAEKLWMLIFVIFWVTRPEIKIESAILVKDVLSTQPCVDDCIWAVILSLFKNYCNRLSWTQITLLKIKHPRAICRSSCKAKTHCGFACMSSVRGIDRYSLICHIDVLMHKLNWPSEKRRGFFVKALNNWKGIETPSI